MKKEPTHITYCAYVSPLIVKFYCLNDEKINIKDFITIEQRYFWKAQQRQWRLFKEHIIDQLPEYTSFN